MTKKIKASPEEELYLANLRHFFSKIPEHQINQEVGFFTAKDLEFRSPCGCFGVWCDVFYSTEHNKGYRTFRFEDGEEVFNCEIEHGEIINAMLDFAGVRYLFGAKKWREHPKDVLKRVLDILDVEA